MEKLLSPLNVCGNYHYMTWLRKVGVIDGKPCTYHHSIKVVSNKRFLNAEILLKAVTNKINAANNLPTALEQMNLKQFKWDVSTVEDIKKMSVLRQIERKCDYIELHV